jgi:hypothetical protein
LTTAFAPARWRAGFFFELDSIWVEMELAIHAREVGFPCIIELEE